MAKTLASSSDKPRRLKFTKPDPARPKDPSPAEARAIRAGKGERFKIPPRDRSRLPDGARFEASYDATAIVWTGTLTVPGPDGSPPIEVTESAGAVFTLLGVLDLKYRAKAGNAVIP